jgi:hypothetical protein
VASAELQSSLVGDDGEPLDTSAAAFKIDPNTGEFSGTPPATNGVVGTFSPLIPILLPSVDLTATIDSVKARVEDDPACAGQSNGLNACYIFYVTFNSAGKISHFVVPTAAPVWSSFETTGDSIITPALGALPVKPDPANAARYGIPAGAGSANAAVGISFRQYIEFSSFEGQAARRGLLGTDTSSVGGSRWFSGDNESVPHPTVGIKVGHLDGIDTVWAPIHHTDFDPTTPGAQIAPNSAIIQYFGYGGAGLSREADVQLTWGENGAIESVRDLTHHVPVKFVPDLQAGYGIVTDASGDGKITWEDFSWMPGMAEFQIFQEVGANGPTDASEAVPLVPTVTVSPVVAGFDETAPATGQGFGLYINGERYIFQLTGGAFPAAGTKWTLRTYSGRVRANTTATLTPTGYRFTPVTRSPVVPGLNVKFSVTRPTTINAATKNDLSSVHTVPDPYYVTNAFETSTTDKIIRFVNLPTRAIIRFYSSSGVLVRVLTHNSTTRQGDDETVSTLGGEETWDVRNRNNQVVASGVYFYHIEAGDARRVGRFTVVNFAQ